MELVEQSLDEIMGEFRMNGKDVDYVELDLDSIDLDRYAPDARSLIVGLLQDSGLDSEMKIIRPPSKTPPHLPTSTISLIRKQMLHQSTTQISMAQTPIARVPMARVPTKCNSLPSPRFSVGNGSFVQGTGHPHPGWSSPMTSPASPSYISPSCVVDLATSMGQIALSDQPNYICALPSLSSSRPIYGSGLSMKPPFKYPKQNRFSNYGSRSPAIWNAAHFESLSTGDQPSMSQAKTPTAPQESFETQKLAISPISLETATPEKNANKVSSGKSEWLKVTSGCLELDGDGASEDEMSMNNESADSGNYSAELSPRSDLSSRSSKSSSEGNLVSSYASIVIKPTSPINDGDEAVHPLSKEEPETPKSHLPEGLKPHPWNQGKFVRSSDSRSSDGLYDDVNRRIKACVFCKTNGETASMYRGHVLKDDQGRTVCHVLRKYVCPLCGATGENAHTVKYCPKNSNPPSVSMMTTLKSMRSATGNVRMMSNTRRIRSSAKRNRQRTVTGASSYGSA